MAGQPEHGAEEAAIGAPKLRREEPREQGERRSFEVVLSGASFADEDAAKPQVAAHVRLRAECLELDEPFGRLVETGRTPNQVYVPLAHTEGGLSASLYRGARAVSESGGFKTFVLGDRITRASCFVCQSAEEAVTLSRFLDAHVAEMRRWLAERVEAVPRSLHPTCKN